MKKKLRVDVEAEEPKFQVEGNHITWQFKRGVLELDVEELDQIFYEYSKHGLNMSQVQVQNKHGYNALEWQSFKRTFDLVKDSDVFSPYSLSLVSKKAACDMIADKIGEKYNPKNMRAVIEYEDRKQTKKAYQKAIKRVADLDFRFQLFETALLDYATEAKPKNVRTCPQIKIDSPFVHVADLHGGADIKASRNLPAFNWNVLEKRLETVARDVNARQGGNVTLVINGDIIESFTGLNHANSWKNLDDENGYGVAATIKATDILSSFISSINNIKEVIVISGNHDRVTSSNKEDVAGEVARLIAYVLNGQFPFNVTWVEDVVSRQAGKCGFIFTHGHLGLGRKAAEQIADQYGFRALYNIVVMGHFHCRKVAADNLNTRVIYAPSIFTGNQYSKNLGFSSRAGYLYIYAENKLPVVIDYPLS